jgi:hypothetical protein
MRTALYDMRGRPDTSKFADLYIVPSTLTSRPKLGNPTGRVLVSLSGTIHYAPIGEPVNEPFNLAVYDLALKHDAIMPGILGFEDNGYYTQGIDLTKRGLVGPLIALWLDKAKDFDGIHWDVAVPLADPTLPWDSVMAGMASAIRTAGKLVVAQVHQLTPVAMASNGQWLEDPTGFGYTLERHAHDAAMFRQATSAFISSDHRESIFVAEMRYPDTFPQWFRDQVRAWCEANNFYLSVGVDANAGAVL